MANVTISDTLYHYTGFGGIGSKTQDQSFRTLTQILESSHLKLCKNSIEWGYNDSNGNKISGISFSPYMTCFTETPIEFSSHHTRDFGKFGIGFKIEWVIANKGQNVIYVKDGKVNNLGEAISRMITHLKIDGKSKDFPRKIMHEIIYATENMGWRHEREWRIISSESHSVATFDLSDIDSLVCLSSYQKQLTSFIKSNPKLADLEQKIKLI